MANLPNEVSRRRTFAIIAHPDAGKTTLTEKLLLFGGAIQLAGAVKARGEQRRARSDWMKVERERGISVTASVMSFEYKGCAFNLLDTPGHEDFSEDTYRTLTAVDSAVMVIDAAKGIEAQTLKLFAACRLRDDIEMARGLMKPFDLEAYREGHLSPVYFGSAVNNFGVGELLSGLAEMAPPPRPQKAASRMVEPTEEKTTAFVFKIQANMDPKHRDRIAFTRLCSGKFERGMKMLHVRSGKQINLHNPVVFLAQDREIAEEGYAGDILGIPNHGNLRIGDTLTEGEPLQFVGIPSFAPEHLQAVRADDPLRAKHLGKALEQLAEEGAARVFRPEIGTDYIVGVVGALQFEILADRIRTEYGLPVRFEPTSLHTARWIESDDPAALKTFLDETRASVGKDHNGDHVFLARNAWHLDRAEKDHPKLRFLKVKEQAQ